jgi:tetratricopeptide (TPR) repeat protein
MRRNLHYMVLLVMMACASCLHAQTTPLPPGTSTPDTAAQPENRTTDLLTQAEDAILRGDSAKALPLLNQAITAASTNSQQAARAFYDRGYIEQQQQQLPAAQADYRSANTLDPKQFESHAALGHLLAQQDQWKEARQQLELAAALQPASGNAIQSIAHVDRSLARVDAQLHDDASAGDALLAALKLTPEEPDDTFLAGQLAEDQKNYPGAEQQYKKFLDGDPKSIPAAEALARVLIHQSRYSDAEPILHRALDQQPNDPVLLAALATSLAGQGKTQDAIVQLETLHRQNPNQTAVTRMLADLDSSSGHAGNADSLYQQLIAADPHDTDLLTAAGENFTHQQKWPQAVQMFQQSVDIQPRQGDAWGGLAFAASQNHQYSLVLTALDQRSRYVPDIPATVFLRATALDHLRRTREAVPLYRQFLSEAQGKFPDEESQTRQRLAEIKNSH